MLTRTSALLLAGLLSQVPQLPAPSQAAPSQAKLTSLLDGTGVVTLKLEAPLTRLFANGSENEDVTVPGKVTFKDAGGADVVLQDIEVSVRGHTSRRETECSFPKLKLKRKGSGTIKVGTHCGESPDTQLTAKFGRLANEKSPHREGLAYDLLRAAEVPTLRTRPARITYVDPGSNGGAPLERNALLLEDDDDAMKRVNGTAELTYQNFGDVRTRHAEGEAGLIAFGEALIGNYDWHLRFSPQDNYRSNEAKPIWNVLAFDRGGSGTALLMMDFDLAGAVVGKHSWFNKVWNPAFVPSKSPIEIEVLSQVQRTRMVLPRDALDTLRRHFLDRQSAVQSALEKGTVDPAGRDLARAYVNNFYKAIADDAFYRPVVARSDVQVFMDPQGTKEACAAGDRIREGTPVNELQKSGKMSHVVILDSAWRWGSRNECDNVQNGPVWIPSDAITADFPAKKPQ